MLAYIKINTKIEAVLPRNVKILYFLSRKCREKFVWQTDPAVYPALQREWSEATGLVAATTIATVAPAPPLQPFFLIPSNLHCHRVDDDEESYVKL